MNKIGGQFKHNKGLLMMAAPGILYVIIFSYLPMAGLIIAFKNYKYDLGIWGSDWVGFQNFSFFFKSDVFLRVTRNTILYNTGFIVLSTVAGLALAVMLNEVGRRWVKVHQTILFLPYFISAVVVGILVMNVLDFEHGFLNRMLLQFGHKPVQWYQESRYWPWILNIVHLWKVVGFKTLIYFAGIVAIDPSYYEAGKMDGATKWQLITRITLPSLASLIIILLIIDISSIFNADFGLFYFTTNDSSFLYPATDVIDTYVYRSLRVVGDIGMSTAVGLYQSCVGFVLVLSTNLLVRKINRDHSLW